MKSDRNHPDAVELFEQIGFGRLSRSANEHVRGCVACTRALDDLVSVAVAMFDDLPCAATSDGLRMRTLAAAGFRLPKATPVRGRAASAARAGSG